MAKTLEPSLLNPSSEKIEESSQNETQSTQIATITPEEAAQYKGRIPTGVKDQVLALNEQKRKDKKQLTKLDKAGAIVQQRKLEAFLEEFLKNGGNATSAAAQVFDVSSRASAATIGSFYLKKAKMLGRVYLEEKGYSYGRLLTIAAKKAEESRLPDWWDRIMGIAGYENPGMSIKGMMQGPTTNINIMQAEKEIFKKYSMEGEIIEEPAESRDFEMEEKE